MEQGERVDAENEDDVALWYFEKRTASFGAFTTVVYNRTRKLNPSRLWTTDFWERELSSRIYLRPCGVDASGNPLEVTSAEPDRVIHLLSAGAFIDTHMRWKPDSGEDVYNARVSVEEEIRVIIDFLDKRRNRQRANPEIMEDDEGYFKKY